MKERPDKETSERSTRDTQVSFFLRIFGVHIVSLSYGQTMNHEPFERFNEFKLKSCCTIYIYGMIFKI